MDVKVVAKLDSCCLCLENLLVDEVYDCLIDGETWRTTNEESLVLPVVALLCYTFKHLEWWWASTIAHFLFFLDTAKGMGTLTIDEMLQNRCIEVDQSLDNRNLRLDSCFVLHIVRCLTIYLMLLCHEMFLLYDLLVTQILKKWKEK